MPERSVDSRLGGLEARADEGDSRWEDVKGYMRENNKTLVEIQKTLTSINGNVTEFKKYQERCDLDRETLDKRVTATENTAKMQIGMAAAAGGVVSFLAWGGSKVVEKVASWFS